MTITPERVAELRALIASDPGWDDIALAVMPHVDALLDAADENARLNADILDYRRREREILGLPDEATAVDHLDAVEDAVRMRDGWKAEAEAQNARKAEIIGERDSARAERDELRGQLDDIASYVQPFDVDDSAAQELPPLPDAVRDLVAERDDLLAVLESGQSLRTHDLDTTQRWVIDDAEEVRAVVARIRAKEEADGK